MVNLGSVTLLLVLVLSVSVSALANTNVQAFYFVQQWLGSYCSQRGTKCCYPPTGKPQADFTIYGLWPYTYGGNFPYNCGGGNYNEAMLKPMQESLRKAWPTFTCPQIGRKFWVHEWNKHGTCSMSVLGELNYFKTALNLKNRINVFQALARAGIRPNNQFYSLKAVKRAVARATGVHPYVDCNRDSQGNSQIWQVTVCVDRSGTRLIRCPYLPRGRDTCTAKVKFPSY